MTILDTIPPPATGAAAPRSGISCVPAPGGLRIRMWGDVDDALRAQASAAMRRLVAHDGWVQIDVSGVTFIDSAGIAFIAQVHALAGDGGCVTLVGPSLAMMEILDAVGLSDLLAVRA